MRRTRHSIRTETEPAVATIPSPQVVAPVPPAALEIMRLAGDRPDFKTRPIQTFADPDNSEI
ncbi:hypothetical protein Hypma_001873 [Hypsizygus marmoreus]|uniref:Uncharacterized protein n=1 Tax=Hypsizygus marmoreus TaxID=39966 RepID=A0A369J756_HYPMA|nr:hypothetical protein Hypma_001873 [Hypsizygus marmoreus]